MVDLIGSLSFQGKRLLLDQHFVDLEEQMIFASLSIKIKWLLLMYTFFLLY